MLIVGVSGGPDSSALLLLLQHWQTSLGYQVEAAYFDHQIRGHEERRAERDAVRRLTARVDVVLHEGGTAVPESAKRDGRSLEEQARLERYRYLAETASTCGANLVAVGHTATDQVETVLLHILRGSGLAGLIGMRARQPWVFGPGPELIRPLLTFSREETERYCRLRGFTPHSDSLNADPAYLRSRLRHELLPLLRTYNSAADGALLRLSQAAADHSEAAEGGVNQAIEQGSSIPGVSHHMSLECLRGLPASIRHEALFRSFSQVVGDRRGLGERHIFMLDRLISSPGEHVLDLPRGIRAATRRGELIVEHAPAPDRSEAEGQCLLEMTLQVPGHTRAGVWEIAAELLPPDDCPPAGDHHTVLFDLDRLKLPLTLRARRAGDRLRPSGMAGRRKVQDILVDAKVPRSERDSVPIICSGEDVVWVAGHRADAGVLAGLGTTRRLRLSLHRLDASEPAD